jgi:hypothetical protein
MLLWLNGSKPWQQFSNNYKKALPERWRLL